MKKHQFSVILVFVVFLAASCKSTPTPLPETPAPTSTFIPTKPVSPTRTLQPAPTLASTAEPDFNSKGFKPRNAEELQALIMFHLNQGKQIDEIGELLVDTEGDTFAWLDGRAADFDGDQEKELLLLASIYIEDLGQDENIYWIAKKTGEQYEAVYSKSEKAAYGGVIKLIDDLNNDNLPDALFSRGHFGSGADMDIFVARSGESGFIIQKVGWLSLIVRKIQLASEVSNGMRNLIVVGDQYQWMSAGPGRTVEETYAFSGREYELLQSRYLPDDYRIHVIQDAQIAYNTGDEKLAVQLWKKAAYDESLINFPSVLIEDDRPELYQTAFALYRLYTYYLSINEAATAQKYRAELNNKYPEGTPAGEFNALATEAKRQLDSSRNASTVCKGIYEFLNSTPENTGFLTQHWNWGDLNYDIVDFCPLRR